MGEYQTNIPAGVIDEPELRDLVGRLSQTMGVPAKVDATYVITTESFELSDIMDNILLSLEVNGKQTRRKPGKAGKLKGGGTAGSGSRSLTNEKSKEVLSSVQVAREAREGKYPNQTTFINNRGERLIVLDGKLIKEPQS